MKLNEKEIISSIKDELESFQVHEEEVGEVIFCGDGIVHIVGLKDVMIHEMIVFQNDIYGICLNLEEDIIKAILLNNITDVKQGDIAKRTGEVLSIPVGEKFLGRIVDPLGRPIDNKGVIESNLNMPIENIAPGIADRSPVKVPLQTGIKAIDSMIPIGRGQRELIIGDRKTGKTALAIDIILNQKGQNVICVYNAIGQKLSNILNIYNILESHGAMEYTIIVASSASDSAAFSYISPYSACTLAEYFMYHLKKDTLCIYDDLSKQANSYRELSLLLERPPGREAFPGDVFYLHSRLLERAVNLSSEKGGGSLTAIPIVETQEGEVSSYIPTNVISITDGQIYLSSELFALGIKPAIDIGISVSRVGGNAQTTAMKSISSNLRLEMAQFKNLESFSQFVEDLDEKTKSTLIKGKKLVETLKQNNLKPLSLENQILIIYCAIKGFLNDIPIEKIHLFEKELFAYISQEKNYNQLLKDILDIKNKKSEEAVVQVIENFIKIFKSTHNL